MSQHQVAWFDAHTREVVLRDPSTSVAEAPASVDLGRATGVFTELADDLIWAAGWQRASRWHAVAVEPGLYWARVS